MKIYEYIAKSSQFNSFLTDEEYWEIKNTIGKGNSLSKTWKSIPVRNFFKDKEGGFPEKISDFPQLSIGDPVFSEKAWEIFEPFIGNYTEPLPLITVEGKYYALNILNIIDALDKDNSEISYNRVTGRVSRVFKHVFHSDKIESQLIFKVPETKGLEVYISEDFKQIVEEKGLKGLDFSKIVFEY